jgi:hypothetical protein
MQHVKGQTDTDELLLFKSNIQNISRHSFSGTYNISFLIK